MTTHDSLIERVKTAFEARSGLQGLDAEIVKRPESTILIIYVSYPTERLYSILNECAEEILGTDSGTLATLKSKSKDAIVSSSEAQLLLKVLSESQNINQHSFKEDFFDRYTRSVTGAESQIISSANHIVTGRRGAGKSMLLLYALKLREAEGRINAWIDLQGYSGRNDEQAVTDVIAEILHRVSFPSEVYDNVVSIRHQLEAQETSVSALRRLIPRLKRLLEVVVSNGELFIFLDDLHIFPRQLQPVLMDVLYALARGNKIYLKISAIENLVQTYDASNSAGLQIPQDLQKLGLDYNLTTPAKAARHIEAILDGHARYSGLPSIRRLCSSSDVLPRLTWVSAGVPRDALNLFSLAILKASSEERKRVTVSNVNVAASENLSIKIRELQLDASEGAPRLKRLLGLISDFCLQERRSNAFLMEIDVDSEAYGDALILVQLRLLHIVSEGITPKEAGKKFIALILDYGLYTGVRAAASVDLFNKQARPVAAKDLRKLPIFRARSDRREGEPVGVEAIG